MNKAEARAWAAGLFLADGTVGIHMNNHSGKIFHRVSFAVRMKDENVVERYNQILDNPRSVRHYTLKNGTEMFSAENTSCEVVLAVADWMIPLLIGRKQRQFDIVKLLCEDIRRHKVNVPKPLPDGVIQYREQLYKAYLRAGATTERFSIRKDEATV